MQKAVILCFMGRKNEAMRFLNALSLKDKNQKLLEQFKKDIEHFDSEKALANFIIKK